MDTAARPPFHVELQDRLAELSKILGSTSATLAGLRERKFGSWPENPPGGGAAGNGAKLPECAEALEALDALIATANRTWGHAEVLADLL